MIIRHSIPQCKSLKTLRIVTKRFPHAGYELPNLLKASLSAITHGLPLNLILVYNKHYFSGCNQAEQGSVHVGWSGIKIGDECTECTKQQLERFEALGEVYKVQKFRLVLCAEVPGSMVEQAMRILECNVNAHKGGDLGCLFSGSSVISAIPPFYH